MWQEVGSHPEAYRHRQVESDRSTLELWSIKAGHYLADLKLGKPERPDLFAQAYDNEGNNPPTPDDMASTESNSPKPTLPPNEEGSIKASGPPHASAQPTSQPDTDAADPDVVRGPSYDDLPLPKLPDAPAIEFPKDLTVPKLPETSPEPDRDGLDKKSRELLERAHKAFDIGMQHHKKAMPNAPQAGRRAALSKTIQYLKEAKKCYEAVLNTRPSKEFQKRLENRLMDVNRILYWAYKHSSVR
jgi:hypothetical protein